MSFRRILVFTCDVCGKEFEVEDGKLCPKGFHYFPFRTAEGSYETKHRCSACPVQANERDMGT